MASERSTLFCYWNGWDLYLAERLGGPSAGLPVALCEDAASLLPRILACAPTAVVLHLNASRTARVIEGRDDLVAALRSRGITVHNAAVTDISKSALHALNHDLGMPSALASEDGPPDEPVIVKTDLNCRGIPEDGLTDAEREVVAAGARHTPLEAYDEYPVMRRADVPPGWWQDERLVVERYLVNPEGMFFRAYFAGSALLLTEAYSGKPVRRIERAANRIDYRLTLELCEDPLARGLLGAVPAAAASAAARFAQAAGMDYGCLDLVIDAEQVLYVVDATSTPYWGVEELGRLRARHFLWGLSAQ